RKRTPSFFFQAEDGIRHFPVTGVQTCALPIFVDSPAGIRAGDVDGWLEHVGVVLVPILPSAIDLEATAPFLDDLAALGRIKRGKDRKSVVEGTRVEVAGRRSEANTTGMRAARS